jgi:flavin reductase (DIM6/NTAB) family NADH-FMN oxidoreductase RutF
LDVAMGEHHGSLTELSQQMRRALSYRASALAMIATRIEGDVAACLTSSVTLVCPKQNLLLICLSQNFLKYGALRVNQRIGLSILSASHEHLADSLLAGPNFLKIEEQVRCGINGAPASLTVSDAVSSLECRIENVTPLHDLVLVVARVEKVGPATDTAALLTWRGQYEPLGWTQSDAEKAIGLSRH